MGRHLRFMRSASCSAEVRRPPLCLSLASASAPVMCLSLRPRSRRVSL